MNTIKIWSDSPSDRQVRDAVAMLRNGELLIIPTDSVYAIACDALNAKAIAELCRIKGINPEKNNLSIICDSLSMAAEYAVIDNNGYRLMKELTPGPFTFLFRAARALPKAFKGRKIVGIRIPDSVTPRLLARELGNPILCTSIEFEDSDHAREPGLIEENYSRYPVSAIIDAGEGNEEFTTIIDCTDSANPEIIRQGKGKL